MYYLIFYSIQDLTHDVPAKNESNEVVYIPVVMIIAYNRVCYSAYLLTRKSPLIRVGICVY